MQAILPLAGKGTRLRPLTHTRPKPLLRVGNRTVLDRVLDLLEDAGVDEIIGIMGHLQETIEAHLASEHPELAFTGVEQVEQLGTADAIRLAEPYVDGPVLIVFVDTLFSADLGLIARHPEADGIIWAKEVEDYQRFGVIVHDDDGYMEKIVEKPSEPISRLANIGVYYIRDHERLFEGIRHVMAQPPKLGEYFLTDAFQWMIDHGAKILTAEVEEWWDCGKAETLLDTNARVLASGETRLPAEGADATVRGDVCVAADVTLEGAEIGPNVSIGRGSTIRDSRLADCIVGENTRLEDCDLRDSLIGDEVEATGLRGTAHLGDHTRIRVAPDGD
ncbi:MAG: sugar phosphate nucleotidyltransferase [Gemmatimonadales bacterium]|jgi:glucose-1-phosphate thymidylyltransferase